ncbi:MAG TPA: YlxR family protein [Nocardioidaceae bacterium]|nr:YlxR family protein [Nocardioidaceae bacterium]
MRTCVGCRERAAKSELIRIVVVSNGATTAVAPDVRRSAGGRGAHLHPSAACLELATRRKAWSRALRVSGPVDDTAVWSYIRAVTASGETERDNNHRKRSTRS